MGLGNAGEDRGATRTDGTTCPDEPRALGEYSGPLDSRFDDALHKGAQKLFLGDKASGPLTPLGGVHDCHVLLSRRVNYLIELVTVCD